MNSFDLLDEKVQSRYSTRAAQYYRDHLKQRVCPEDSDTRSGLMTQQPSYEEGR